RPGPAAAHGRRSLDQQSLGTLQTAGDQRVGSEPGQAPPQPTGAAAWISSRSAPSKQQGIGVPGDFQIQLDPAAAFVQFACGGGID
ncbi:MAG: hypothetical protein E6044_10340, partial [Actinomyces sp.]|nr:hypothetical protein [Actinomyces sp.]